MTPQAIDTNIGVTIRVTGGRPGVVRRRESSLQAARDAGKETQMKRILRLTVALLLGVAALSPILGASQASACHYTSQDRAKGYKC